MLAKPSVDAIASEKYASSDTTIKSHMFANMIAPARHAPCTCEMVGLGKSQIRRQ